MTELAYTVGFRRSYDRGLSSGKLSGVPLKKVGRVPLKGYPRYQGGYIFPNRQRALAFLRRKNVAFKYAVYGVVLEDGWQQSVSAYPHPTDGVHRLLVTSRLQRL